MHTALPWLVLILLEPSCCCCCCCPRFLLLIRPWRCGQAGRLAEALVTAAFALVVEDASLAACHIAHLRFFIPHTVPEDTLRARVHAMLGQGAGAGPAVTLVPTAEAAAGRGSVQVTASDLHRLDTWQWVSSELDP